MKTLLTTILLLLIYIAPVNAQGPSIQADPLTRHILTLENPCEDELYLDLRKIALEEMTDRQYELFLSFNQSCYSHRSILEKIESQEFQLSEINRQQKTNNIIFVIATLASIGKLIVLLDNL